MTQKLHLGDQEIEPVDPTPGIIKVGDVTYHLDLIQGTDDWLNQRLGIMTASEMKLVLTATLKIANNAKEKQHLYALLAQRITRYVEPNYVSDDMLRGIEDEIEVRRLYSENHAPVHNCGFITTERLGFVLGYSPDGLIGDEGLMECKSRLAKYQVQTILADEVPLDYMLQLQTGLLVTGRKWIDFVSYCAGLPMFVKRVFPEPKFQTAIVDAARGFEMRLQDELARYKSIAKTMIQTERKDDGDFPI